MTHTVLSDHTADCLRQRENERRQQYQAALSDFFENSKNVRMAYEEELKAYEMAVRERQEEIEALKTKKKNAWKQWALLRAVKYTFELTMLVASSNKPDKPKMPKGPEAPVKPNVDEADRIWESGREGEQRVVEFLQSCLNSDIFLLSGYRNRKGEIDKILVSTEGIFAIEVKHINGHIFCDGDNWWRDKYDRYGHCKETEVPITDRTGGGPSRQVNEASDVLEAFLRRTMPSCRIYRMVVFTHESSILEDLNNPTVNEVIKLEKWDLQNTFDNNRSKLRKSEMEVVIRRIQQNHHYMNNSVNNNKSRRPVTRPSNRRNDPSTAAIVCQAQ